MSGCPLCGSPGDDLVFRFYCTNRECANWVPEKEPSKERLAPEVYSPLFTMANLTLRSFHNLPPGTCYQCGGSGTIPKGVCPNNSVLEDCVCPDCGGSGKEAILPKGEVFRIGEPKAVGSFPVREDARIAPKDLELCREIGNPIVSALDDEFELHRRNIIEALRIPKEFFGEPGYGSRLHEPDDTPYPKFQLVMDPIERGLFLVWIDKVPAVLNMFVEPIMERRIGEPMREGARLTTRDEIIQCLLRMRGRGELVWDRFRSRWELHFTE